MRRLAFIRCSAILALVTVLTAFASVANATPFTYTYVGNPFDASYDLACMGCINPNTGEPVTFPLSSDYYIYASVTLDLTLGVASSGLEATAWEIRLANGAYQAFTSDLFEQYFTDPSSAWYGFCHYGGCHSSSSFDVDSAGKIVNWGLHASIQDGSLSTSSGGDSWAEDRPGGSLPVHLNHQPGQWSDPVAVPDPGTTLLLFGIGLAGLGAWRKRWH